MEKGVCPICGKRNGCHMTLGLGHENCWCNTVKFDIGVLKHIPEELRGISCTCRECTEDYSKSKKVKKVYDLHTHSLRSDGTMSPSKIVELAKERGLLGVALTDHDTVTGISEGRKKAEELGMEFIPGIELSSNLYGNDVHILGYFIDEKDPELLAELEKLKRTRDERNIQILEKLKKYKINITPEELEAEAGGEIKSKLHIANLLMKKGVAYSKAEAFASYLGKHGVAYVERKDFTPQKAVELIKKNGGLAVLAHPKLYSRNLKEVETLVVSLKKSGLDGIESEYPIFLEDEKENYRKLAKKYDLFTTGGSDFHGNNRVENELGSEGVTFSQMELIKSRKMV